MKLPFQLAADREFDVFGFGTNTVDHLITVGEMPAEEQKIEADDHTVTPGGEIASTLCGLSRLGFRTRYAGAFGDDEAGRIGRSSLEREGVDTSLARTAAGVPTQTSFIFVNSSTGERTIVWRRDPRLNFGEADVPAAAAASARVLHLTAHDPRAAIALAQQAKSAGTVVSLDIDSLFDHVKELLPLVGICITSETFPAELTGESDLLRAIRLLQREFGFAIIGTTVGSGGSLILVNGDAFRTPSYHVPGGCVDTTGAGDAFRAGFLAGVLKGLEVEDCAAYGNAVAALKCRRPGAREGLPDDLELQTLLKNSRQ